MNDENPRSLTAVGLESIDVTLHVNGEAHAFAEPVEGLGKGEGLHPLQAAFIKHDAFQCGYCTPGQLCSAAALLSEGLAETPEQIREAMSGNLCRCGAYPNIVDAILEIIKEDGR